MIKVMSFAVLIILLASFASAEILAGSPAVAYGFGEPLSIDLTIKPAAETSDFIIVSLICESSETDLYKNFATLGAGEEMGITVKAVFGSSFKEYDGQDCALRTRYGEEEITSQPFRISSEVSIALVPLKKTYDPKEKIEIKGTARRVSGNGVGGFIEATLYDQKVVGSVKDGVFSVNLTVPEKISGAEALNVNVYEKDSNDNIITSGNSSFALDIRQIISSIEIGLPYASIIPGSNLTYTVILKDQEGNDMEGEVAIKILKPKDVDFWKGIIAAGETGTFETGTNFSAGYWSITAAAGNLEQKELFLIEEKPLVLFSMVDGTIVAKNVGNIPFQNPVEFTIGSNTEVKIVSLKPGETRKYSLSAPEGDYLVSVSSGEQKTVFGLTPLTGRVVGVGETGRGLGGILENTVYAWILMILIIGGFAAFFFIKNKREKVAQKYLPYGGTATMSSEVGSGMKHEAAIVALSIKSAPSTEVVSRTLAKVADAKMKSYSDGRHSLTVIPASSEDYRQKAIKIAKDMEGALKQTGRIQFGIGVHTGEVIAEKKEGITKFISVGNAMNTAKKISDDAEQTVLVSEPIYRVLAGKVKFKKHGEKQLWSVDSVMDRSESNAFIGDFLNRQDKND